MNLFKKNQMSDDELRSLQLLANFDVQRAINAALIEPESLAVIRQEMRMRGLLSDGIKTARN